MPAAYFILNLRAYIFEQLLDNLSTFHVIAVI
jgi:hypothetical protein